MSNRIACCVPFCRRTHRNDENYAEWLCAIHFGLTDAMARKVYKRIQKRDRQGIELVRRNRIWQRLKRQAFERGLGIE